MPSRSKGVNIALGPKDEDDNRRGILYDIGI